MKLEKPACQHDPVKWGILGVANIAVTHVIPAIQASPLCQAWSIGSRSYEKSRISAEKFNIPKAYGSYEAVIDDPEVEAIYIPLPNHMHIDYAFKAACNGKHVLCEKPIGMTAKEVERLRAIPQDVYIAEAFMPRHQPRWKKLRDMIHSGSLGQVKAVNAVLSFTLENPADFRNTPEYGGGALYDLGCYAIMAARYLMGKEPERVMALMERHPESGVDSLFSGMLDFGDGRHATFTVSTEMAASQYLHVIGDQASVDLPLPFIPARDKPSEMFNDTSTDLYTLSPSGERFSTINQYECEVSSFAKTIREQSVPDFGIEDALCNMRVIDALFSSAGSGNWKPIDSA